MSTLMSAISTIGGNYDLNASKLADFDTLQAELEYTTATMYMLSQRKIDYGLSVSIPAMTAQLQKDATFASFYGSLPPEYERARVGVSNGVALSTTTTLNAMMAGASPAHRHAYLALAERISYSAAAVVASMSSLSRASAHEAWRMARDKSMAYLFSDIEHATKVRGIADAVESIGMAGMFAGAKEALDVMAHSAVMAQLEWDKQQITKRFDTKAFDIGAIVSSAATGIADGYSASKADAALAKEQPK